MKTRSKFRNHYSYIDKNELNKELYVYGSKQLEQKFERKRHLEIKSLYVLQASAILITLFIALIDFENTLIEPYKIIVSYLQYVFYFFMFVTIVVLLMSLDDTILSWLKRDKEKHLFQETKNPKYIKDHEKNANKFFENIVDDIDKSICSSKKIILIKNRFFLWGLRTFIISITILVIMGVLIA